MPANPAPSTFTLDPRLRASSHLIAQLPLCTARLQDDARFPWIVLVPTRPALTEIADLEPRAQRRLWLEAAMAGRAARALAAAGGATAVKLNHGQLGNVVAQLHIHVVARRPGDQAWPGPVWGWGSPEPYGAEDLAAALELTAAVFKDKGLAI